MTPNGDARTRIPGTRAAWVARVAAVIAALAMIAATVTAQEPLADGIDVGGTGAAHGEPDRARLELGVDVQDPEVREAMRLADEAMARVQEALRSGGVAEEDLRTSTFRLWREDPADRGLESGEPRFRVLHLLDVTVRDVDAVGELLAAAVEAGADRIGAVTFEVAEPAALEEEARRAALADAREKATQLAREAGRALGPVQAIREPTVRPVEGRGGAVASLAADGGAPVAPGTLRIEVSVRVRFALE